MRLRLSERLRRLASWRFRGQAQGRGWIKDSRPREDAGKHRRSTAQPRFADGGAEGGTAGAAPGNGPLQPPAGLPQQYAGVSRQAPPVVPRRGADGLGGGPAGPPIPRNYTPGAGGGEPLSGIPSGFPGGVPAGSVPGDGVQAGQAAAGWPGAQAGPGGPGGEAGIGRPPAKSSGRGGAGRGGVGRARIREAPFGAAPGAQGAPAAPEAMESVAVGQEAARQEAARQPWYQVVGNGPAARQAPPRAADAALAGREAAAAADVTVAGNTAGNIARPTVSAGAMRAARRTRAALPFAPPHSHEHPPTGDGRRNCGALEAILWRQWDAATTAPSAEVIAAIDRLAEFPRELQEKLAAGLEGIYVGDGGVPDLDDMSALHGVLLPSGRATWDACAGAYGEHKIVVGSRPSPTPDVMCHEVGHALDDLDSPPGKWQSDSAEFRMIYDQCQPYIASDFHRQRGGLGRKEFFADAFAAIASAQRPALVDMLSGNTRIALRVMLYFNRRYGI